MHYYVFDIHDPQGWVFRAKWRWVAAVAAHLMGARFDYTTVPFAESEFDSLTGGRK